MADEPVNPRDEEIEAIQRIAASRDGMLLHRYLRRILESCRLTEDPGTLQRHEGARILARDLMGHMARGIEGSSGRPDDSTILSSGSPTAARPRGTRSEQRRARWAAQSAAERPTEPDEA